MQFVKLTMQNGSPAYVHPEAVEQIRSHRDGGSEIMFCHALLYVQEAPEDVARMLEECPAWRTVEPTQRVEGFRSDGR